MDEGQIEVGVHTFTDARTLLEELFAFDRVLSWPAPLLALHIDAVVRPVQRAASLARSLSARVVHTMPRNVKHQEKKMFKTKKKERKHDFTTWVSTNADRHVKLGNAERSYATTGRDRGEVPEEVGWGGGYVRHNTHTRCMWRGQGDRADRPCSIRSYQSHPCCVAAAAVALRRYCCCCRLLPLRRYCCWCRKSESCRCSQHSDVCGVCLRGLSGCLLRLSAPATSLIGGLGWALPPVGAFSEILNVNEIHSLRQSHSDLRHNGSGVAILGVGVLVTHR
jgi:hypothetical protein